MPSSSVYPPPLRQPAARLPTRRLRPRPRLRLCRDQQGAQARPSGGGGGDRGRHAPGRRLRRGGPRLRAPEVNDEFTVSVAIARCQLTPAGFPRWRIRLDRGLSPDITAAVRMDHANERPLDYYLLPSIDMSVPRLKLAEQNGLTLDGYRFETPRLPVRPGRRAGFAEAA